MEESSLVIVAARMEVGKLGAREEQVLSELFGRCENLEAACQLYEASKTRSTSLNLRLEKAREKH